VQAQQGQPHVKPKVAANVQNAVCFSLNVGPGVVFSQTVNHWLSYDVFGMKNVFYTDTL